MEWLKDVFSTSMFVTFTLIEEIFKYRGSCIFMDAFYDCCYQTWFNWGWNRNRIKLTDLEIQ